jgi:hypothetical protein
LANMEGGTDFPWEQMTLPRMRITLPGERRPGQHHVFFESGNFRLYQLIHSELRRSGKKIEQDTFGACQICDI